MNVSELLESFTAIYGPIAKGDAGIRIVSDRWTKLFQKSEPDILRVAMENMLDDRKGKSWPTVNEFSRYLHKAADKIKPQRRPDQMSTEYVDRSAIARRTFTDNPMLLRAALKANCLGALHDWIVIGRGRPKRFLQQERNLTDLDWIIQRCVATEKEFTDCMVKATDKVHGPRTAMLLSWGGAIEERHRRITEEYAT